MLNAWLDRIPRATLFRLYTNLPAFRTCGLIGFAAAVPVALAAALATARSPVVVLAVSAAAAASFFLYAYVRRWITGEERMVLLEHVWFALLFITAALAILRQPVPAYLDLTAPALAIFLAFGRFGCTFVGCCHGVPSTIGIVYPDNRRFPGIRLFPVAAVEAMALLLIGASCFVGLRLFSTGATLAWFLLSYAIARYLLESVRGDDRPHLLGLSVPRWMCLLQGSGALIWMLIPAHPLLMLAAFPAAAIFTALRFRLDPARRLLAARHVAEMRALVAGPLSWRPLSKESSAGVRIAASAENRPGWMHVSLSGTGNLVSACRLAAAAFPNLDIQSAKVTGSGALHFLVSHDGGGSADDLYLHVVRSLQAGEARSAQPQPDAQPVAPGAPRPWYFAEAANSDGARGRK